jgi:hypothetical protein
VGSAIGKADGIPVAESKSILFSERFIDSHPPIPGFQLRPLANPFYKRQFEVLLMIQLSLLVGLEVVTRLKKGWI